MSNIPKTILQNPYRMLGVYANSPKRDIIANKGKATAFLKVNRPVEYPLDLKGILPSISRTVETMNEAEAHLAIAKEQIQYAQFWFMKATQFDEIAFNHLLAGNIDQAISIWSKQDNVSSLQNRMLCYLIKDSLSEAITIAQQLYNNFGDSYIEKIDSSCTLKMTAAELRNQFIDSLADGVGMITLLNVVTDTEWKTYIKNQSVGPLIAKISNEVEKAKKVDHKNSKARIEAVRKLYAATKEPFALLKQLLKTTDSQFMMIADKLGLEILQCGIDYFNNSNDEDRHKKAMQVQKYAQSVVVGTLAKQRCQENVNILQDLIDKLPPEEVKQENDKLQQLITLFILAPEDVDAVLVFLRDTSSCLVSIKTKLGKDHSFYQQQATLVAQMALSKSIDALNDVQKNEFPKLKGTGRQAATTAISHAFAASWEAMLWIELIESDNEFKENRLKPNKEKLKQILDNVDAFKEPDHFTRYLGGSYSIFEGCARNVKVDSYVYYTEAELYEKCTTINICKLYLSKYPYGEHANSVNLKLQLLREDAKFKAAKTISDYQEYLNTYPNGRYIEAAKRKIQAIKEEAYKKRQREQEQLLLNIEACKNVESALRLTEQCGKFREEGLLGKLDEKCFNLCRSNDDYEKYLSAFPNGQHFQEAKHSIRRNNLYKIAIVLHLACVIVGYSMYYVDKSIDVDAKWNYVLMGGAIGCFVWLIIIAETFRYRNRQFLSSVLNIAAIILPILSFVFLNYWHVDQLKRQYEADMQESYTKFVNSPSIKKGLSFLSQYSACEDGKIDTIKQFILSAIKEKADSLMANENDADKLSAFYSEYAGLSFLADNENLERIKQKADELKLEQERIAEEQRLKEQRELEEKKKREEYEKYGTDQNAWRTATARNTIGAYREYLKRYPRGQHVREADKKIIDLEVQAVVNSGDYGYLPPAQKTSYGTSKTSIVNIKNSSSSTITIMYSGIKSLKLVLSPHQSTSITLPSSTYKVVATAPGVRSFYGTENLTGGNYQSEFYIVTSRY